MEDQALLEKTGHIGTVEKERRHYSGTYGSINTVRKTGTFGPERGHYRGTYGNVGTVGKPEYSAQNGDTAEWPMEAFALLEKPGQICTVKKKTSQKGDTTEGPLDAQALL